MLKTYLCQLDFKQKTHLLLQFKAQSGKIPADLTVGLICSTKEPKFYAFSNFWEKKNMFAVLA